MEILSIKIFEFDSDWNTSFFVFYLILASIVVLFCKKGAIISYNNSNEVIVRKWNKYYFLSFLILFIVSTFRSITVGTDTIDYVIMFQNATLKNYSFNIFDGNNIEIGYYIYINIIRFFTSNYTVYFAFYALITCGATIVFIKEFWNEKNSYIFLLLFIIDFHYNLSAARSGLATAFLLLSLVYMKRSKSWKSIGLSIIAILFHYSFIIHFLFLIMYKFLFSKLMNESKTITILLVTLSAIILNFFLFPIQEILLNTRYKGYVQDLGSGWLGNWELILQAILVVFYYYNLKQKGNQVKICTMTSLYMIMLMPAITVLGVYRIPKYYLLPRLVVWTHLSDIFIQKQKSNNNKFMAQIIVFGYVIFFLLFMFSRTGAGIIYETILFDLF